MDYLKQWQADYDEAVGKPGRVVDVIASRGRFGGIAIWVEVEHPDGTTLFYSPYLNQSPGDGEHDDDNPECSCESCSFDDDPDVWLDSMKDATDWGDWDWGPGEESIPAY